MNYSIIFEATRKGFDGDIAVDDIRVTEDLCPVRDRECDFEANSCHLEQVGDLG